MLEMIEYWFNYNVPGDTNFCTDTDIQLAIDIANNIMDSTVYIRPLIYRSSVTDYDGNVYPTVIIGHQEWLAENLKSITYRDGTPIPNLTDATDFFNDTDGAYVWYNNDIATKNYGGALYNWFACTNVHNLAPTGFRVPTMADFDVLIAYVGGAAIAGGKLKEVGTAYWVAPNVGATDLYGFKARGSGNRFIDDPYPLDPGFDSLGVFGDFLTTDEGLASPITDSRSYYLYNDDIDVTDGTFLKSCGMNVRCVRDV
jgi:uncharacterized protein (TIGR02145 family)